MNNLEFFIQNKFKPIVVKGAFIDNRIESLNDEAYIKFLSEENGGYYFKGGIHFYGATLESYDSLNWINDYVKSLYSDVEDCGFIGEDIFGNLFCVKRNKKYYSFNIETGELDEMGSSFKEFISVIVNDLDFYTGEKFLKSLDEIDIGLITQGYRLCPKYPFVLGGAYEQSNLILKKSVENLKFSNSIYSQIKDLPDGTKIDIKFD